MIGASSAVRARFSARSPGGPFVVVAAFVVAAMLGATACADSEPFVTYIGVVDATPPRLGRPLALVLPAEGGADAAVEANVDAGTSDAAAVQDTGPGEEMRDGSPKADGEAAPESGSE